MDAPLIHELPPVFPVPPPRYRIDALSGRGGAGSVYRAFDYELGRPVALKFLRDDRPRYRARLLREARAQARVDHPNVCRVFDVVEEGERLFIAMQWIDGQRLDAIGSSLSLEEKIEVLEGRYKPHGTPC